VPYIPDLAEQLEELHMRAADLHRQWKVPTNRITEILKGQRAVTGDTVLCLGHETGGCMGDQLRTSV
jgi:plasmid maintenance system antidote protein VapI